MIHDMIKEQIRDIVWEIIEAADKVKQENGSQLKQGQLLAYAEALEIIKSEVDPDDWEYLGLNFNIDGKYFSFE